MAKKRTITVKKYIGTANKFLKYGGKFINNLKLLKKMLQN